MTFATLADMQARFGADELAQLATGADVAQALADTDAEIAAHVAVRYALPLTSTPALLAALACDLARERLYHDAAPEVVLARARAARRLLVDIAAGRLSLGASAPAPAPAPVASGIDFAAPARRMTLEG